MYVYFYFINIHRFKKIVWLFCYTVNSSCSQSENGRGEDVTDDAALESGGAREREKTGFNKQVGK